MTGGVIALVVVVVLVIAVKAVRNVPQGRAVLAEATPRWGVRVDRIELESIEPSRAFAGD